ncbi:uncharacterized protein K489DRAFT_80371 [Dissoconium aciculare CBS 342.82]|uniref:Uncharacterized protein n=1 Tax=Dissoconium aciculare CBS 342.82 TaxID=1314786 RepID=A0A6J3LSQ3_9PEZI|nr:uncharacterized protein K489DRAFT_80371 [Dissoconium aciculare CBS 342.82]KAF1818806.1 hypothetical protein K489DRAFT_80371 [Dissoconium aciculare CBS 342.82]
MPISCVESQHQTRSCNGRRQRTHYLEEISGTKAALSRARSRRMWASVMFEHNRAVFYLYVCAVLARRAILSGLDVTAGPQKKIRNCDHLIFHVNRCSSRRGAPWASHPYVRSMPIVTAKILLAICPREFCHISLEADRYARRDLPWRK